MSPTHSTPLRIRIAKVLIVSQLPIAMLYLIVGLYELVNHYYSYNTLPNGIRYGLIGLNPIRSYSIVLIIGALGLGAAITIWIRHESSRYGWKRKVAVILCASSVFVSGIATELLSDSATVDHLSIGQQAFYVVRKNDMEYGVNCYLLACTGLLDGCTTLGQIRVQLPVTMQYSEPAHAIIVQNSAGDKLKFPFTSQ